MDSRLRENDGCKAIRFSPRQSAMTAIGLIHALFRLASAQKLLTRPARGTMAFRCMGQRPVLIPFKLLAATQSARLCSLPG
jgi:hypothetical protein